MSSKELILIVLAIIVAGCIIAGAIFLTADTESVPVNNTTAVNNTTNITENKTVEEINDVKEDTPKKTSSNYDPVNYDMIDTDGDGIGDSPGQYYGSTQSEIDQYEADIQREQALYG